MTVDHIIPCVCCEHPPSVDDSTYYGMPVLKVSNSIIAHKQFWTCGCPKCGRGGIKEFKSPYLAIKDWNALQKSLYEYEQKPLVFEEPWRDTCDRLGYEYEGQLSFDFKEYLE